MLFFWDISSVRFSFNYSELHNVLDIEVHALKLSSAYVSVRSKNFIERIVSFSSPPEQISELVFDSLHGSAWASSAPCVKLWGVAYAL